MSATLRKIVVETMIPANFKFMARDLDGSVHVFENKPNLDYGTNKRKKHIIILQEIKK